MLLTDPTLEKMSFHLKYWTLSATLYFFFSNGYCWWNYADFQIVLEKCSFYKPFDYFSHDSAIFMLKSCCSKNLIYQPILKTILVLCIPKEIDSNIKILTRVYIKNWAIFGFLKMWKEWSSVIKLWKCYSS